MKKKIVSILIACALCVGLISTAAFASNDGTSVADGKYTINLGSIPENKWNESKITVKFILDGDTENPITVSNDPNLGSPVRLDISSMNGSVTFLPIRAICDALSLNCKWVDKSEKEEAHALITTPKGTVKLYSGATSITAEDGTIYQEETYLFPDGSHIPLCLVRDGRIYVPVRFLSTFVLGNVKYDWSRNGTLLTVTGGSQESSIQGFEGVGVNTDLVFDIEDPLASLPNTKLVADKYGFEAACGGDNGVVYLDKGFVSMRNTGTKITIKGFDYSANDIQRYEATCALIRDVCDKESADALVGWISEANDIVTDYWNGVNTDENKIDEKLKNCPSKFGNISVKLIYTENGIMNGFQISKA